MKQIIFCLFVLVFHNLSAQTKISPEEAYHIITKKASKIQLLDVRTPTEFEEKHLERALSVDWNNSAIFEEVAKTLNKKKPVYVYCRSGARSAKAAQVLTAQGFNVVEIEGGILNWESKSLPLVEKEKPITNMTWEAYSKQIASNDVVLIDFYATWCLPCKKIEPHIDFIQKNYKGKVKVLRIDIDQNKQLMQQLQISSIPYLVIYKHGQQTWNYRGYIKLKNIIKQL